MAKGYVAGFARMMIWEYVQSGTYVGMCSGVQSSLTAGTASGAYVWDDVKGAAVTELADAALQITGGDKVKATVIFPGGKLSDFEVNGSSLDTALNTLSSGSTPNTTNSGVTVTSNNPGRTSLKTLGAALQAIFVQSDGTFAWITRVIPRAQMKIRPGGFTYRGESDSILKISSIVTNRAYDGQVFGSAGLNLNLENDRADYLDYITVDPFHIMAFRQDAAATTFTTTYKPLSTVITLNATQNPFSIGGTPTALTSLSLAGLATLAAAGTANVYDTLGYASGFVPV